MVGAGGAAIWDAAGYLSMTLAILEKHYGHHHPDDQAGASKRATSAPPPFAGIWPVHDLPDADRKIRDKRRAIRKEAGAPRPLDPLSDLGHEHGRPRATSSIPVS